MTRINLVDPSQLVDKHLMAEYRELPRIFTAVKKLQDAGKTPADVAISDKYILGTGHCKFFYNKCGYLKTRYLAIVHELGNRSFNLDQMLIQDVLKRCHFLDDHWKGFYYPKPEEVYLNMQRITDRYFN